MKGEKNMKKKQKHKKYNKLKLPHNYMWFKKFKHCAKALSKWSILCNIFM